MKWLNRWFSFSWKKLVLVAGLVPLMWFVKDIQFGRVEAFIRDSFQYLNSASKIEKSIVTVNINGKENNFERPLNFAQIKKLLDRILEDKPKNVIIALSVSDLYYNDNDIRSPLMSYLENQKNVFLFTTSSIALEDIENDPILKNYPRIMRLTIPMDRQQGPRDFKRRRMIISYDMQGAAGEFKQVEKLGFLVKSPSDFPFTWNWWGSRQAYLKVFPEGTFGSYDAGWLINQKNKDVSFEGKTVIVGPNDEYSFLFSHSVFDLVGKVENSDYKAFPVADTIANAMNLYITGDYMKLINNFNDLAIVFFILAILIFMNIDIRKKIIVFASLIPAIVLFSVIFYIFTDFYINISRSLTLVFFLQYFAIPFIVLSFFKDQELRKQQELTDTRIDALLTVSEKVAHDIRSPLSAINLVMHKVKFDDPEYKDIFDSAVQRIDETATKILTRYRTKTGSENEAIEQIDLAEIISSITKEKQILNVKVQFEFVINSDSTIALGSKLDLERIISNILDNSIFALQNILEPRIFISIDSPDGMVRIGITDNGTGIPEQVLKLLGTARITTKADTNQGNGIGILHAKRVIERLNGRFEISSAEHVGTTIKISLPKA